MTLSDQKYLITILIASYNRLELLKNCIQSINTVGVSDIEVLIVDDGSDGETRNWLNSLDEKHVRVIYQQNMGVAKARQVGLEESLGKYVCILDSDDQLIPNAIMIIRDNILKYPEVSLFYSNNLEKYNSGETKISNYREFSNHSSFIRSVFLSIRVPFKHSGTTFKRIDALEIGGYNIQFKNKIDIDFLIRFLKKGFRYKFIEDPLVVFYFHKDSISRSTRFKAISTWVKIIELYGPDTLLLRVFYKLNRYMIESLKYFYETVFFIFTK